MINGDTFLNMIDQPIDLEVYTSFTIMVQSVDSYALVMHAPVSAFYFFIYLSFVCSFFLPISVVFMMLSIIKGGKTVRKHLLTWMARLGMYIPM